MLLTPWEGFGANKLKPVGRSQLETVGSRKGY